MLVHIVVSNHIPIFHKHYVIYNIVLIQLFVLMFFHIISQKEYFFVDEYELHLYILGNHDNNSHEIEKHGHD